MGWWFKATEGNDTDKLPEFTKLESLLYLIVATL